MPLRRGLNDVGRRRRLLARGLPAAMPLQPPLVAAHPLLEPFAGEIGGLIGVRRHAMGLEAHALPQMDGAVGPKLPVLLLDAHMPRSLAPDELLDSVHHALLDVTAQRLTDVQVLSGNLYRHCPRMTVENGPFPPRYRAHAAFCGDRSSPRQIMRALGPISVRPHRG